MQQDFSESIAKSYTLAEEIGHFIGNVACDPDDIFPAAVCVYDTAAVIMRAVMYHYRYP